MLGFKASDLGHRPRKPVLGSAARAATVIAGVVSAVVIARTAVPYSAAVIAATTRAWMAPPFLFAAIHFIILFWKLSENQHQDDTLPLEDDKPLAKIASLEIPQTAVEIIPNNYPEFHRSMSEQNSGVCTKLTFLEPPVVLVAAEEENPSIH